MEHFKPSEIRAIARAEMDKWGLNSWKFALNNSTRALGLCNYGKRTIYITCHHVEHDSKEDVIDTLRHEIAHGVHYLRRGDALKEVYWSGSRWMRKIKPHGREWKAIAREVGVKDISHSSKTSKVRENIEYKWNLVLVVNGKVEPLPGGYQRRPSVDFSQRYMRGRKRESMGNIYFVPGNQFRRFERGDLCRTRMKYFQRAGVQVNPFGG